MAIARKVLAMLRDINDKLIYLGRCESKLSGHRDDNIDKRTSFENKVGQILLCPPLFCIYLLQ